MPRAPRAYLWEARRAALQIQAFVSGRSEQDYGTDAMLRSAVERQFEIIGEALSQLSRVDPEMSAKIPDLPRIVAFRNVLIHGYASVDDQLVWDAAASRVDPLQTLLGELIESASSVNRAADE